MGFSFAINTLHMVVTTAIHAWENLYLTRRERSLFIKCFLYNHINAIVKDADSSVSEQ